MGNFIHINVDSRGVKTALAKAPEQIVNAINLGLRETAVMSQRYYRQNMPVGATGFLRRSTTYSFLNRVTVKVEPYAQYADYVEYGTKPHWTSVHNLERWANLKGINPYALQRSIAYHGTKPHPFQQKTYEQTASYASEALHRRVGQAVERILE